MSEAMEESVNGGKKSLQSDDESRRFLIVRPERGGVGDLLRYASGQRIGSETNFLEASGADVYGGEESDHRWVIVVSIVVTKLIALFGKPLEWIGYVVDFVLNLLSENGNFLGLLCNLLRGKVVVPHRDTDTFISTIGHFDGRIDLYKGESLVEAFKNDISTVETEMGDRALMDLCIMASKLAYENAKVVSNIVTHHWKMHFVDFYNCWNDYQKQMSTQVFILSDKPTDANLILISFRGTEPFDADDWITDFDYSWYEVPGLGKVHMGFLEALGLGNRINTTTFQNCINLGKTDNNSSETELQPVMGKKTAYYSLRSKLKSLLVEHKNAKFVVTGHSLGGALAILFPTVLDLHGEKDLLGKLLRIYTFGQPRIGDKKLGKYMESQLNDPIPRYFRVVYCNDLVPRLPYDDKTFLYKHFGVCLYFNSMYIEQKTKEEPNKNYFGLRTALGLHLNAIWELIRSLISGYLYGPEYEEGWFSTLTRIFGLFLPGISAHCPTDYVNSVRLGRERGRKVQMSSF